MSCNDPIDDCTKQPCSNGGTCVDQVQGLSCTCPDAWGGQYCELGESVSISLVMNRKVWKLFSQIDES